MRRPVIAPFGFYVGGSIPTGAISWDATGNPSADSALMPMVEIINNATSSAAVDFSLDITVMDASGKAGDNSVNRFPTDWDPLEDTDGETPPHPQPHAHAYTHTHTHTWNSLRVRSRRSPLMHSAE